MTMKEKCVFYSVFFISGCAALFYQLVWQRALFAIYGLNIESVTVIVTGFIFGLGMGSLLGGWLSKIAPRHVLLLFACIECVIGLFGYHSLTIFKYLGDLTIHLSTITTLIFSFLWIALPTLLMGMTLPLLVHFLVQRLSHVGQSVGNLYFVNTLGSAIACFLVVLGLMGALGQLALVKGAALLNFLVACVGLGLFITQAPPQLACATSKQITLSSAPKIRTICFLACLSGFIALSYEIIWVKTYGFISGNVASVFAQVLASYLIGLALGGLLSSILTEYHSVPTRLLRYVSWIFVVSSVLGFLFIPTVAQMVTRINYAATFSLITCLTILFGMILPLLCHLGFAPDRFAGAHLSYIYCANIIGATLGSFLTGFVLLDHQPLYQVNLMISLLGILLAGSLFCLSGDTQKRRVLGATACIALAISMCVSARPLFNHLYEKLHYQQKYVKGMVFSRIIENKAGVIFVTQNKEVFGNNVYDGGLRISPLKNDKNGIFRAFSISAFVKHPKEVLLIGLSSGVWAQVLANHPEVNKLTIIEINPGYLQLIPHYPLVASLLHHPKVEIVIDDGRRWLRRHPEKQFDLIVMNATFYWREHASNLLSADFLLAVRHALKPAGVFFYNLTGSQRALHTAHTVYPSLLRVSNFIAVSDQPFDLNKSRWKQVLQAYRIDGKRVFNSRDPIIQARLRSLFKQVDVAHQRSSDIFAMELTPYGIHVANDVITDDNMGDEW